MRSLAPFRVASWPFTINNSKVESFEPLFQHFSGIGHYQWPGQKADFQFVLLVSLVSLFTWAAGKSRPRLSRRIRRGIGACHRVNNAPEANGAGAAEARR